jgi:hypothetical protein
LVQAEPEKDLHGEEIGGCTFQGHHAVWKKSDGVWA